MRMAFGLVGLLVTIGVIIMIMHYYTLPAAKTAIQTKQRVQNQFGSNSPEGMEEAQNSIVLDDAMRGSHFDGLLVKGITPGGAMSNAFGLLPGDKITAIGPISLRDNDSETAKALLFEAKLRTFPLTVLRSGAEIQLKPR